MLRGDHQTLITIDKLILLGALLVPSVAFSQDGFGELLDRELEITRQIEEESIANGPRSEGLIDLLTELSFVYEEIGDYALANTTTERMLEVIRANQGLYSLDQVAGIKQLMSRQEERENAVGLWELEQELLYLADRNPGDLRTISIFSDAAARRLEILRRYESGEFPPEIILGCYYRGSFHKPDAWQRGSQPMFSADLNPHPSSCSSGSNTHVKRALLNDAQALFNAATGIALRTEGFPAPELRDLLSDIVFISYRTANYGMGRHAYGLILDYEANAGSAPLVQAEWLVQQADWEIIASRDLGTRVIDDALSYYQEAYESLQQAEVPQESIDALFNPAFPVSLPSFMRNPLDSREEGSTGYIDVSFDITSLGKSGDIEIVGTSETVRRADTRDLVQLIERTRFRPRIADGELLDSARVSLRYYLSP